MGVLTSIGSRIELSPPLPLPPPLFRSMASPETPAKETPEFVSSNEATQPELPGEKVERGEKWVS